MSDKSLGLGSNRGSSASRPIINALLVGAALFWGVSLLVRGGRLTWPPYALLNSLSTLAGCLALVGPLVLIRNGEISGSLGELVWLTGGLLVWVFDIEGDLAGPMEVLAVGNSAPRPGHGSDHAGRASGGLEVRTGQLEMVVDQSHRLAAQHVLDRDGDLLLVRQPSARGPWRCADP